MRSGKIRRRNDSGPLDEIGEFFFRALEPEPPWRGLEGHRCEHFPADLENKVIFPLNLFCRVRQGKAILPNPLDVHTLKGIADALFASSAVCREALALDRKRHLFLIAYRQFLKYVKYGTINKKVNHLMTKIRKM